MGGTGTSGGSPVAERPTVAVRGATEVIRGITLADDGEHDPIRRFAIAARVAAVRTAIRQSDVRLGHRPAGFLLSRSELQGYRVGLLTSVVDGRTRRRIGTRGSECMGEIPTATGSTVTEVPLVRCRRAGEVVTLRIERKLKNFTRIAGAVGVRAS